jgi:ketosteroid isomerase-like protein
MRTNRAFLVWEEALRFVRERDLDGYAGQFAPDGVVELPLPLPGMPRLVGAHDEIRSVLAPVWRSQRETQDHSSRVESLDSVVDHETLEPEIVVIEFDLHGVEASGMPYRLSYVHVVTVRDGRIATLRAPVDADTIRQRVMSTNDGASKALVRRYFAMWNTGDFDGVDQVLSPRYVDHAHPELVGPAGVVAAATRFRASSPSACVTIDTLVADGDLVAARTTLRYTRDGEALVTSGMSFFRVSDGKLAEQWSCYPHAA